MALPVSQPDYRCLVPLLRRRVKQHNREALVLGLLSLGSAAASWALLYLVSYWLLLLFLSSVIGETARMPAQFGSGFLLVSAALLAVAWLDRRMFPDQRPPDRRPLTEIVGDFVLAVPRMTLAVPGTFSAWLSLAPPDLAQAAKLLVRVLSERRLAVSGAPQEVPDERTRERVIFALLLLKVVELRREEGESILRATSPIERWHAEVEAMEEKRQRGKASGREKGRLLREDRPPEI